MVSFLCKPTDEKQEEDDKEVLKNQSFVAENNKPNEPFDLASLELDDFPLTFDGDIDLDSIRDWIEEDSAETYSMDGFGKNPVGNSVENNDFKGFQAVKVEHENGEIGFGEKCVQKDVALKLEPLDCSVQENSDFGVVEKSIEMGSDGFSEKIVAEEGMLEDRCQNLGEIGCSIEEELGKVSLDGVLSSSVSGSVSTSVMKDEGLVIGEGDGIKNREIKNFDSGIVKIDQLVGVGGVVLETAEKSGDTVNMIGDGARKKEVLSDEEESDSESEDESGSSSSSSSSSSSESSSDEDGDEEDEEQDSAEMVENIVMEEGEIMSSDADGMIAWSEDEDEEDAAGGRPIKSKNELTVLPPVPPVNATLLPHHQTLPVGVVSSIIGAQVIVEGVEKHSPLNEGSILWITESKSPLGLVDEIFGPVENPYYIVRFNSESDVPAGIRQGLSISFVPEFADHILNNDSLYKKGYDASGDNDEELSEEIEFSDDEKEAEYRRMQKMKKRGTNDGKIDKKNDKKSKNRSRPGNHNQFAVRQVQTSVDKPPTDRSQLFVQPVSVASSSDTRHVLPTGPASANSLPPSGWAAGGNALTNMMWPNGFPGQQAPRGGVPPMQGMPWLHQNHPQQVFQGPFPNGVPFQPQINIGQTLPSNNSMLGGQSNFGGGPAFLPWLAGLAQNVSNQLPFVMGMPGQHAQNVPNQSPFGMGIQGQQALNVPNQPPFGMGMQGQLAQNVPNQSPFGMGMEGQHAPIPMNAGEAEGQSNGSQPIFSANPGTNDSFQKFTPGMHRGAGRKSHRRGGGRFGHGRGRHQ